MAVRNPGFLKNQDSEGVAQPRKIMNELHRMRETKELCDFTIKIEREEFYVHRNILMANSKYFRAMFTNDTAEKRSVCVEFEDLTAQSLKLCIDCMYCQSVSKTDADKENLLKAACRLDLAKLRSIVLSWYESDMKMANFYHTKTIAETFPCEELSQICDTFAASNFTAITQDSRYQAFSKEYVFFLLTSKDNWTCATNKMRALFSWITYNVDERKTALIELLPSLAVSEMTVRYRWHLMNLEPLTSSSLECIRLLASSFFEGLHGEALQEAREDSKPHNAVVLFDKNSKYLQCYIPEKQSLFKMVLAEEDYFQYEKFWVVSLHQHIYFYGQKALYFSASFQSLKYIEDGASWEERASLSSLTSGPNTTYRQVALATGSNAIYSIGNSFYSSKRYSYFHTKIYRYDPAMDQWRELSSKSGSENMRRFVCVFFHQGIFFIGPNGTREVKIYDVSAKEWSETSPIKNPVSDSAVAVVHKERIYLFGGKVGFGQPESTVEIYCERTDIWTQAKQPLNTSRILNVCSVGHQIFALMSSGTVDEKNILQKYNLESNVWEPVEILGELNPICCVGVFMPIPLALEETLPSLEPGTGED